METVEAARPPLSSAYSADTSIKETPQVYGTSHQYFATDATYTANEKGIEDQSPRPRRRNPHRKFSKEWWATAWDLSVEAGRWPRVAYFSFGVILIIIWIVIMLTFAKEEVKYEKANQATGSKFGSSGVTEYLFMQGSLGQFDPDARVLTVSWSLMTYDSNNNPQPVGTTNATANPFNIYRDLKAVPEDRRSPLSNVTFNPNGNYRIDNITAAPIAVLGLHDWDNVDTDIEFAQAVAEDEWKQPLFAYPFDEWTGSIVLAATDRAIADQVDLPNSIIVDLTTAALVDSTLNWKMSINSTDTCQDPEVFAGCELHIDITASRPALVKFAALVAVVVNWTSTIGIFLLTGEAVVMKRHYILKDTDILGVCLTALFALPSVRAILPGAPDFGAIIDLVGIIPNILLISLCTTVFSVSKLMAQRPTKENKDD